MFNMLEPKKNVSSKDETCATGHLHVTIIG